MIIINRFGENNVLCSKYIHIYEFRGVRRGHTYSTFHFLFIIKKDGKFTRARPILESNSTSFRSKNFFPTMNNKNLRKEGPRGPRSYFFTK